LVYLLPQGSKGPVGDGRPTCAAIPAQKTPPENPKISVRATVQASR